MDRLKKENTLQEYQDLNAHRDAIRSFLLHEHRLENSYDIISSDPFLTSLEATIHDGKKNLFKTVLQKSLESNVDITDIEGSMPELTKEEDRTLVTLNFFEETCRQIRDKDYSRIELYYEFMSVPIDTADSTKQLSFMFKALNLNP